MLPLTTDTVAFALIVVSIVDCDWKSPTLLYIVLNTLDGVS